MHTSHNLKQGSPEWHAHRRVHFNASEAPAMMGASKYTTRAELLAEKATGIAREVNAATQRLFDSGHAAEAGVRLLVQDIIGEDLYPVTASLTVDGLPLSASYDGLTMDDSTVLEVKLWNEALAERVRAGDLEPHYYWQLEQQLMIVGAEKAIFATGDGTAERLATMEYRAVPGRREQLIAGWKQFAADLDAWKPAQPEPVAPAARAPEQLPALLIEVTGAVTASNLAEFKATALTAIRSVNRDLKTDQDFADAGAAVKWCGEVESRLKAAKEHALSQTASIDLLFKTMDDIGVEARAVRLELDKLIKTRTEARKHEIVDAGIKAYGDHVRALNERLGKPYMPVIHCDFAGAIKGMRSFTSIQNAVDAELARVKIESSGVADRIQVNLNYLREHAAKHAFLFADTQTIVQKAPDDLAMLVKSRIGEHEQAEAARLEREREAIRAEEQAKAEREARAKLEAEQAAQAAATPAPVQTPAAAPIAAPAPIPTHMAPPASVTGPVIAAPAANVVQMRAPAPPADDGKRLKLGEINAMIAPLSINADGLADMGFKHVATDKSAKLYRAADFPLIVDALVAHLNTARDQAPMAA